MMVVGRLGGRRSASLRVGTPAAAHARGENRSSAREPRGELSSAQIRAHMLRGTLCFLTCAKRSCKSFLVPRANRNRTEPMIAPDIAMLSLVGANDGAAAAANLSAIRRIVDHSPDLPAVSSVSFAAVLW